MIMIKFTKLEMTKLFNTNYKNIIQISGDCRLCRAYTCRMTWTKRSFKIVH